MGSNKTKSLNDLSDDELQALAESDDEVLEYKLESDVQSFLVRYQITSGSELVSVSSVYKFYRMWSERPVYSPQFLNELNVLLDQQSTTVFKLNKAPVEFLAKPKKLKQIDLTAFYNFIQKEKITPGKIRVHLEALRLLYNKWAGKSKLMRLSDKRFKSGICKFLKIEIIEKEPYTAVDAKTNRKLVDLVREKQKDKAKK
jgi:hypothetical protein